MNANVWRIQVERKQRSEKMAKKIKTLPQLFEARDKAADKATRNIFDAIPGAMEAINELTSLEEIKSAGGDLVWDDLELIEDELIILVGVIVFPPGCEVITTEGDKVKVTESTAPYFRRLVRVGLPLSVATQPKEEVVAYFKKVQENEQKQLDLAHLDESLNKETEFDLSALTEEQRRSYQTGMMVKPGKA